MKILIIRNYPTTMIIKNQSYNIQEMGLAKALTKKGHTCDVVFWTDREDYQIQVEVAPERFVTVYYIQAKRILKNGVFPKRLDMLADRYDIVQISEYNQWQTWKYAKRFQHKMVVLHGPYYAKFNKRYNLLCAFFDLFFLRRYHRLGTQFMVKSALAEKFLLEKGIRKENISKVYVGIDEQVLKDDEDSDTPEFVKALEGDPAKQLLYIGRLEPRRSSLFLLEIFHDVQKICPDTKLVVVGDGDERYKERFRQKIQQLGLEDSIYWTQKLQQKYLSQLYERAKVFLLPTQMEIFGMVLLEAMYFSVPPVTSYNGGSSTLIQNGENGLCIKNFDKEEWTAAVTGLLKDEAKREQMGKTARETIRRGFTWDMICEGYLKAYQKKLEGQCHD